MAAHQTEHKITGIKYPNIKWIGLWKDRNKRQDKKSSFHKKKKKKR